jgi:hypothetical protein
MADYHAKIRNEILPTFPIAWGELPGRSGELVLQRTAV